MMTKNDIIAELQQGIKTIIFDKKDGTERVMKATLQESVVPATTGKSTAPDTNITVFDTEISQWRSIRVNSIKSFA
tara:strand:- start:3045 stop:3272 length:228 start_codon:yes stop_codon:yes gene_type:complete